MDTYEDFRAALGAKALPGEGEQEAEEGGDSLSDAASDEGDLQAEDADDLNFPDEMQTPEDVPARIRFQKFRGLKSFRTSPWDAKEDLPRDYARIFQFADYRRTERRVLGAHGGPGAVEAGCYVTLHLKDIAAQQFANHPRHAPLLLSGLLPYENKMSVVNFAVSRALSYEEPVAHKQQLLVHAGFRRYEGAALWSEHSTLDKHKMDRFLRGTGILSFFAPISFRPTPVLLTTPPSAGAPRLVAHGSLHSVDPDRVILKKVVLSGAPIKIHKRRAVIRRMFFSPEDVRYFRPVDLWTKHGRLGVIEDATGTHGHFKARFDGQISHGDTICMSLYKRVYPKWVTLPNLQRPGM